MLRAGSLTATALSSHPTSTVTPPSSHSRPAPLQNTAGLLRPHTLLQVAVEAHQLRALKKTVIITNSVRNCSMRVLFAAHLALPEPDTRIKVHTTSSSPHTPHAPCQAVPRLPRSGWRTKAWVLRTSQQLPHSTADRQGQGPRHLPLLWMIGVVRTLSQGSSPKASAPRPAP